MLCAFPVGIGAQISASAKQRVKSAIQELQTSKTDSLTAFLMISNAFNDVQNDSSIIYIDLAYDLIRKADDPYRTLNILSEHDRYLTYKRDYTGAEKLNRNKINVAKQLKDPALLFQAYYRLGSTLVSLKEMDSATTYFDMARKLLPMIRTRKFDVLGGYYSSMGIYKSRKGELDAALQHYLKALSFFEKSGNIYRLANIHNNIGHNFRMTGKPEKAIESLLKSLQYCKKGKANLQNFLCHLNLSGCYFDLFDLKKALNHAKSALEFANRMDTDFYRGQVYDTMAAIYADMDEHGLAIMNNFKALEIYRREKKTRKYIFTLQNLSIAYIGIDSTKKSRAKALKALQLSKEHQISSEQPYIYELLSEIDIVEGKHEEALENYKVSIRIADSLQRENVNRDINALQVKYQTLEKEKEIEKLNSAFEKQELQIKGQRYENYTLWGVSSAFFLALTSIYFQYRTKRRNNLILAEKNKVIQNKNDDFFKKSVELKKALKEKDVLLKEIHHRVKNNLQLVTSLLNLQADPLESRIIDAFVARSHNRIASMALVHEVLYKSNKIERIALHDYLKSLVTAVYESFDFTEKKIDYEIHAKDIFLDIDTIIPLGIIINEMVHNAFKYAFKNRKKGRLEVKGTLHSEQLIITVEDDGSGIPARKTDSKVSYGLKLVQLLIDQLEGTLTQKTTNGTYYMITLTPKNSKFFNHEKENIDC